MRFWNILWSVALYALLTVGCGTTVSTEKDEKSEVVPVEKLYATFEQKGTQRLTVKDEREKVRVWLSKLEKEYRSGASNVFLVRGEDIGTVLQATKYTVSNSSRGDKPGRVDRDTSKRLWLVVYLGTAPSKSPAWSVVSVERKAKVIRVSVKKEKSKGDDKHRYFVWAPLGELPDGVYSLELQDADAKEVTLTRRVEVPKYK